MDNTYVEGADNVYADDNLMDNAFQESKDYLNKSLNTARNVRSVIKQSKNRNVTHSTGKLREYASLHAPQQVGGYTRKKVTEQMVNSSSRELIKKGTKESAKKVTKQASKQFAKQYAKESIKTTSKVVSKAGVQVAATATGTAAGSAFFGVGAVVGYAVGNAVGESIGNSMDRRDNIRSVLQSAQNSSKAYYRFSEQHKLLDDDISRVSKFSKEIIKFIKKPLKLIMNLLGPIGVPVAFFLLVVGITFMSFFLMIASVLMGGGLPEKPIYNVNAEQAYVASQLRTVMEEYGFNEYAIAGALGNIQKETSLNPSCVEKGGGQGLGLIQVSTTNSMYSTFKSLFYGGLNSDCEGQMKWLLDNYNLPSGKGKLGVTMLSVQDSFTSVNDATDWWYGNVEFGDGRTCQQYEGYVYHGYGHAITLHEAIRYAYANNWYNYIFNMQYGSDTGSQMVENAYQYLGNHYVYGGTDPTCTNWECGGKHGVDCSGFTQYLHRQVGISIPRTAQTQADSSQGIDVDFSNPANLMPGDLIFYGISSNSITHVAMYIGGGKIIHASSSNTGIKISDKYNYRTIQRVKRFY